MRVRINEKFDEFSHEPSKVPFGTSSETLVNFCNNYLMERINASSLGSGGEDAYI